MKLRERYEALERALDGIFVSAAGVVFLVVFYGGLILAVKHCLL